MKIAILAFSSLPHIGGAEVFTYNLGRQLTARGHTVHLLLPYYWYRHYLKLRLSGAAAAGPFCIKELLLLKHCPAALTWALRALQAVRRYDVWQVLGSYPAAYVARGLAGRVPTVMRSYGADIQKDSGIGYGSRLDPVLEQKITEGIAAMTRLVALTPAVAECFQELGVPTEKIVGIPNGIELARFSAPVDRERLRAELGLGSDETVLLTVGRYHIKKGYEYIPEAARRLIDSGHKIKWVLVGKGLEAIAPLTGQHGVREHIVFHPEVTPDAAIAGKLQMPPDRLVRLYRSADMFVLPSLIEGLSNVLLEAMAAGLPVVTTDSPGNRDVIRHRENGLLAQPADVQSLSACISTMIENTALRAALLQQAQQDIERYGWRHIAEKYETLYAQLIENQA